MYQQPTPEDIVRANAQDAPAATIDDAPEATIRAGTLVVHPFKDDYAPDGVGTLYGLVVGVAEGGCLQVVPLGHVVHEIPPNDLIALG